MAWRQVLFVHNLVQYCTEAELRRLLVQHMGMHVTVHEVVVMGSKGQVCVHSQEPCNLPH